MQICFRLLSFISLKQNEGWEPCMIWPCPPVHDLGTSLEGAAKVLMPTANHETSWYLPVECIVPVSQWKDFDLLNTWRGQMDSVISHQYGLCLVAGEHVYSFLHWCSLHIMWIMPFLSSHLTPRRQHQNETRTWEGSARCDQSPSNPSKRLINGKWQIANDSKSTKYIKYESLNS